MNTASPANRRDTARFFPGFTDLESLRSRGTIVLSHGHGIEVVDVDGRAYLDANSGLWNTVAGFDHPELVEAMVEQTRRFPGYHSFFGRVADVTIELADRLIEISPFDGGRVFFTNSGSEANDSVVKMLWLLNRHRGRPGARKILTRINAYHGVTVATASMTGKPYNEAFGLPLPGFLHADCPHHWRYAESGESEVQYSARLADRLDALIEHEGADTIAGFFAEPVMGAGGVIVPPDGYFDAIQPVLRHHGIPFIADEVICGFGRTGALWGSTTYGIRPDAIVASKCLTNGYFPMGAIILDSPLADELYAAAEKEEELAHGFTAGGHPVGAAVALKAIDLTVREGGLLENVQRVMGHFQARLATLADHEFVGEARGVGLMGALEVVEDKGEKRPFAGHLRVSERIADRALDHGLICRPLGKAIVLCPPHVITEAEIDTLFDRLDATMADVFDAVRAA